MESAVVALGTLFALAVIVVSVLWQERSRCVGAVRRSLVVGERVVQGKGALEAEAAAPLRSVVAWETIVQGKVALEAEAAAPPLMRARPVREDEDGAPSTLRSGR